MCGCLIEFAIGRLGLTTAQVSRLVQVGRSVLVGQGACWLLVCVREAIDSARAGHATACVYGQECFKPSKPTDSF